ncbi:hypothetical protein K469DRAFT_726702 [Zopfia rhizophila CBS 207.26]|uniref:Trichothecene 3-O-acetyltransferas-like protein n=1 Tax=Zopfia rhizophila CBS 207.26 TaxID=1314779 RepID=A0A6A6E5Y9_9PEZI|nr:hypothetical protein K469DRAFT_726702 [Zopfia rhizophila CBS 207.26]
MVGMISRIADNALHLSITDQVAVRAYIRNLLIFPFPDPNQAEDAIRVLKDGLQVTLSQLPYLAGTLGPADPQAGKIPLSYTDDIPDISTLFDYSVGKDSLKWIQENWPNYEELREAGMPPSMFPGKTFAPRSLRNLDGMESTIAEGKATFNGFAVPVMGTQAFFIPGGLVLSIYVHHSVVDGTGLSVFYKRFSENVRLRRSGQALRPEDHSTPRRQVDTRTSTPRLGHPAPACPPYTTRKFDYAKTLAPDTKCSGKLFIIRAARIRDFRDSLTGSVKTNTKLTVFNVLAALVWIHVTRARAPHLKGYEETNAGIAVDVRRKLKPALDKEYMGNMAIYTKATLPIEDFVAEERVTNTTLIPVIQSINTSISNVDNEWVKDHLSFFSTVPKFDDVSLGLHFSFGTDLFITSWMNFGAEHEWDIPGTTSRKPEFIRKPHSAEDGGVLIMPRRYEEDAPYEVLIQLANEDMARLLNEVGGLTEWADKVV